MTNPPASALSTGVGFGSPDEALYARLAIEDVLKRYCRAVDRGDWDLLRTVYHPDATDDHGVFKGSVDDFIAYVAGRRAYMEHSAHIISNILVDFLGTSTAVAETYCVALQRFGAGSQYVESGRACARIEAVCRYVDRFERRSGAWRIARRTMVSGDLRIEQFDAPLVFGSERVVQRPDPSDFLYTALREPTASADD